MDQPHIVQLNAVEWGAHPTLAGVYTRVVENRDSYPMADVLLARVAPGGEIPWHVHAEAGETAYVLSGEALLKYAPDEQRLSLEEQSLQTGDTLTIPPGWWHTLINSGESPLELFAFHVPPTF